MDLKYLKSGTDVRGTAVNPENPEKIDLTDAVIMRITAAFVRFLAEKKGVAPRQLKISVGHDSRVSAQRIKKAVIGTLAASCVQTADCALCSTPAMFMTAKLLGCDGAVQITASHHPWDRNGLKFFTQEGGLSGEEIAQLLAYAQTHAAAADWEKPAERVDFMAVYCAHLREMIKEGVKAAIYDKPLAGMRIVVDAGNGVGGFYARDVLEPLGANTAGSRYLEPDGMFPNHIPNPENAQAMESIRAATLESHADLGVIFDTDVDRGGCVSADGDEINRNRLVALAASIALENDPGGTIVTDSVTSAGLTEFVEQTLGGRHRRFKRGYKNVIDEAIRLEKEGVRTPLAIETSGHAAFRENYFLDDGAYLVTKIIIKAAQLKKNGKTVDELIHALKEPAEEAEIRLQIQEADFRAYGEEVIRIIEQKAAQDSTWKVAADSCEGIKISFADAAADGFFILRVSVHDPVIPVNIESAVSGGVQRIAQRLYAAIHACAGLNLNPLEQIL